MTAIAAVIALSSAPVFAQSTDIPADQTATPVIESTPVPVAADPIAPAASTTIAADPVARKTSVAPARKATAAKTAAQARPASARATRAAIAPAAAATTTPVAEAPAGQPLPIAGDPVATAPIAPATASAPTIDVLRTAALGGLGLLMLAGGALALRSRRRRRADEAEGAEWQQDAEAEPTADADLAMAAEPEFAPAEPAVAAVASEPSQASDDEFAEHQTDLPEDFEISRFGPNVQDAYRGPTEDNPSLSLKTRLSRAHGMDQQEQKLADEVEAVTGEPILDESETEVRTETPSTTPPAKPAVGEHGSGDFILAGSDKKPIVRPANT